jgi:hypothetical protein
MTANAPPLFEHAVFAVRHVEALDSADECLVRALLRLSASSDWLTTFTARETASGSAMARAARGFMLKEHKQAALARHIVETALSFVNGREGD